MGYFDEYSGKGVFKDITKLGFDYVPDKLVHRESQIQRVFTIFRPIAEANVSASAFFTGSVGTGKTALGKRFCMEFQKYCQEHNKGLDYVMVNCRQRSTDDAALLKVLHHFDSRFPDRGFSIPEKLESLRKHLEKSQRHLVVVLDEADVLIRKKTDLIYQLSRFDEEYLSGNKLLSIILISQRSELARLDPASLSTFKASNTIAFDQYTERELYDIGNQRLGLAFRPGAFQDESLVLAADIAAERGDARRVLELMEMAGHLANESKADEVTPEHVRGAKAQIESVVDDAKLRELDRHRKLVMLSVARTIGEEAYVTTGEVEKAYAFACEEYGELARGHTQFWKYLKDLDARGLLGAKATKGKSGTTTKISLPDIPSSVLKQRLEKLLG